MCQVVDRANLQVHCRTGSLESLAGMIVESETVHCRTGSLENTTL